MRAAGVSASGRVVVCDIINKDANIICGKRLSQGRIDGLIGCYEVIAGNRIISVRLKMDGTHKHRCGHSKALDHQALDGTVATRDHQTVGVGGLAAVQRDEANGIVLGGIGARL